MNRTALVRFIIIVALAGNVETIAQSATDEKAILTTIAQVFKAMEQGDSASLHASFTREVTMAVVRRDKEGKPLLIRESSLDGFLKAVGTPHPDTWFEESWNFKVQIDGDLAQVWCDYAFYLGNKFSHCGVDAFQLHREKDGWKIFHLADTRRSTDCVIPLDIQRKHNVK